MINCSSCYIDHASFSGIGSPKVCTYTESKSLKIRYSLMLHPNAWSLAYYGLTLIGMSYESKKMLIFSATSEHFL